VSLEAVTVNNLAQTEGPFVVAGPGEGTWFATDIAEAALFGWWFDAGIDSDLDPVIHWFYSGLVDGQEYVGYPMGGSSARYNPVFWGSTWASPTGTFLFRILDTDLGGGETYTFDARITTSVNGADTCDGLTDNTAINLPAGELGDVRLLGSVSEANTDTGANSCGSTGERPDVRYRMILTERRRVSWFLDSNSSVRNLSFYANLEISTGCGDDAVSVACSEHRDGTDLAGDSVGWYESGGSVVLDPGTYTFNIESESASSEFARFLLDLRLEAVE
jgi:hypothetical protein